MILVVGATNRSNSNRLREIGTDAGIPSYLIADGSELKPEWIEKVSTVGITAGASAPEVLVEDVISALRRFGPVDCPPRCPAAKRRWNSACRTELIEDNKNAAAHRRVCRPKLM